MPSKHHLKTKSDLELVKSDLETAQIKAKTNKLRAETEQIRRRTFWMPFIAISAVILMTLVILVI